MGNVGDGGRPSQEHIVPPPARAEERWLRLTRELLCSSASRSLVSTAMQLRTIVSRDLQYLGQCTYPPVEPPHRSFVSAPQVTFPDRERRPTRSPTAHQMVHGNNPRMRLRGQQLADALRPQQTSSAPSRGRSRHSRPRRDCWTRTDTPLHTASGPGSLMETARCPFELLSL